nr:PREDICTED: probable ergosterol biosynthetic protein 28 [Bos mutus]
MGSRGPDISEPQQPYLLSKSASPTTAGASSSFLALGHSFFQWPKARHPAPGTRHTVNGLQARTFGVWTLLSSVVRCLCAIDIHNKTLYYITLWTFFIGMGHLLFELFVFGTVAPMIFILAILTVASISILGMLVGLRHLEAEPGSRQKKRN